jgi:dissimilatory sulfite reductase related protein
MTSMVILENFHRVDLDEDGLLKDAGQWTEALARAIAEQDGIGDLTEAHWQVIRSLRDHYAKFGVAPAMSHICWTLGMDKLCVHDLFGTCMEAWRVAGLPNPGEEAKAYLRDM